jgi:hypothetical protein
MSPSRHHDLRLRPTTSGSRRRGPAALVALALALSGAVGIGGPAVADGPALVIDDFVAPTPANRSVALSNTSLAETGSGTRVSIGGGGGSMHYAEFTWDFLPSIDLTQAGSLTQMQLDYSGATGTDSAGNPLGNPIMMGLYVTDSSGGTRYRGGTGVIPGSGKFVTNFTKQGDDDYRYLEGTGNLTSVSQVKLFIGTSGNYDTAAITVEWLAAVAAESAYTMPTFTGPATLDVQRGSPLSASIAVAGYPRPTVTTSGSLPPGVTATTTGTTVTLSGTPTTVGEWDFTVHGYTLDWLTGSHTVHIRSFVAPTVTGTAVLRPQVGVPFSQTLTVGGEPLPTTATFSPALPAGLTGTIAGTTLTIAGTATGLGGPLPTTVTVGNGYATASLALDLAVTAPAALPLLDDVLTVVGSPITPIAIAGGGYPAPAVTVSGLPTGLTATPVAGGTEITGTPAAAGTSTVSVTATNGIGAPASDTFSLVVGTAPTLDVAVATPAPVGVALRVPITVTGYPAPVVTAADLPAGLTVSEDADGWAIHGTPTGPDLGPATVTLTATNGLGTDATITTVLTVMGAPTISGPTTLNLHRGSLLPAGVTFIGTGYPIPVMTLAGGQTLPPGLTMTDDDGVLTLSGTPTEHGVWNLTVVATNARGTSTRAVRVTVGTAPVFAQPEQTITLRSWAWIDVPLVVTSSPAHTLTIVGGALPPGIRLETDGSIEGYTTWGVSGRYTVQIEARNTFGVDTLNLTIDVLTPPSLAGWETPDFVGNAGEPMSAEFTTEGWTPPTVTLLDPLPEGLVLTQDESDPHTWRVTGTVAREDRGSYPIRVSLDNGYGTPVVDYIRVSINADLRWSIPSETTVRVERGVPITPVQLELTGYPVPGGTRSIGGLGLSVEHLTRTGTSRTLQVTGTINVNTRYWLCGTSGGVSCATPLLYINFVAQDRPVITAQATVTAPAGSPVSIPITVTGTPAATLTATGIPAGLRIDPTGTGAWTITGTPDRTVLGEHTITLTANNGLTSTATIALAITGGPEVVGPVTVTAPVGEPLTGTVIATTGFPLPTFAVTAGALPPGVSLADGSGGLDLSGTPTTLGSWTVAITATNTAGAASTSLTIDVVQVPEFAEDGPVELTLREGDPFTYTALTTGYPVPTWAVTGPLPAGVTLVDGVLSGTPAVGSADAASGRFEIELEATNAFGSDTLALSLVVLSAPTFPAGLPTATIPADTPSSYTFTTGGWDRPTVTLLDPLLDPLPDGLSLGDGGDADPTTWSITGTVSRDVRGPHSVQIELSNAFGVTTVGTLDLVVTAPFVWDPVTTDLIVETGVPIAAFTTTGTGYPLPRGLWLNAVPEWLSFTSVAPTPGHWLTLLWRGTPTVAGTAVLTLTPVMRITPMIEGPPLTVTFHVTDRPAITAPATPTVLSDTAVDILVTVGGSPVSSVTAAGLPTGLTLVAGAAPGEWHITGTVARDTFGSYDVTLTADNGLVSTHDLTLTVGGLPELDDATVTTYLDAAADAVVRSTGSPLPTLAVTAGSLPPGLTATDDGAGGLAFTGTPTAPGRWDVTVTATNAHGSDSATVSVEVWAAPVFADTLIEHTLREGDPVDFTAHATGYPAQTVEIASGVLPAGLTLSPSGRITGIPSLGSADAGAGRYDFVLRAWNSEGEDTVPVTLVVLSRPSFPVGLPTMSVDAGIAASYTFTTGGWDRPTVTLLDPLPDGLILDQVDQTTWRITGTVTRDLRGPHFVRVALDNAFGVQTVQTLRIDVHAALVWGPAPTSIVVETGMPITPLVLTSSGYVMPGAYGVSERPSWIWWPWYSFGETDFAVRFVGTPTTAGPARLTLTPWGVPGPDLTVTFLVTDRPVITAPASVTTTAGDPLSVDVTVAGSPMSELTATGLPTGVSLEPGGITGTWQITGTPLRDALGEHTVTLTAENGLTSTLDMTLTVIAGALLTTPTTAITTRLDEPMAPVTWTASGYPAPDVELVGTLPSGVLATAGPTGLTVSGTPSTQGTWQVVVRTTNAHGTDEVTVTIRVDAQPQFLAGTEALVVTVGTPTSRTILVSGTPEGTVVATGLPAGLALTRTDVDTWTLTGTPAAGGGRYVAHLTADNGVSDPATADLEITVREPVTSIHATSGALREGVPATIDVTTQGGWPTVATLRVDGALPDGLRFVDDGDGTGRVVGTPAAGTAGRWSVTLVADNGVSPTRVTMALRVAAAPVAATAEGPVPGSDDGAAGSDLGDTGSSDTGGGDTGGDDASDTGSGDEVLADDGGPKVTVTVTGNRSSPWWWALLSLLTAAIASGVYVTRRMLRT